MYVAFNTSLLGVRKGRKKKARQVDLRRPRVVTIYIAQNPNGRIVSTANPLAAMV